MILVAVLALVTLILLLLSFSLRNPGRGRAPGRSSGGTSSLSICPLCGSPLKRGERVHTAAFPGINERMVHIFGCPYCHPRYAPEGPGSGGKRAADGSPRVPGGARRVCPVCHRELREGEYLTGRMRKSKEKTYIRVLGCSRCTSL